MNTKLILVVVWVLCIAAPALAQSEPTEFEAKPPWAAVMFSLVFALGIAAAGFKNSRRTHLD